MKLLVISHIEIFLLGLRRIVELVITDAEVIINPSINPVGAENEWNQYDMLILHISDHSDNVSDFLKVRKHFRKDIKVLILSDEAGLIEAKFLFSLGVKGYTDSRSSLKSIEEAIRIVLSGKLYADSSLIIESFDSHLKKNESAVASLFKLSVKELEIATYLIQGFGTNQISQLTNRKPTTISTQKTNIFNKLKVRNVVELMKLM
ncbi:DNA-binding response regulator, NarL/FixJ family, contains REC and HTH domains [Dyadobacter koreensis]|uniref:DNA-binding response regulator, NarL/FixJ family, contains REC and HTH domains n=1 Tax=Dyadobacter koreensis TaxID=408657 RepID=A0A1H7AUQ0_9BACT|nr:response regulator transcription factor [Dyadobacter koreensis]SEJ69309.1 DNA-binding response regulator, NarL/FixJ family, contains REC and HTH domains [Dyadobacter koreensis]